MAELSSKEKAYAVADRFYLERADGSPLNIIRALPATTPTGIVRIIEAFDHSISAVISTMGIPVALASAAAHSQLWTQVLGAERIRALTIEHDTESADSEARTLERAKEHMERHLASGQGRIGESMCDFLLGVYDDPTIPRAAAELHAQGTVLLWSAFEVLARALFSLCLNSEPRLALKIADNEVTKRLFQLKGLDLALLSQYGFDVSRAMGDILLQAHSLGNLIAIKQVFGAMFPDDSRLRDSLSDRELWILSQRRNLIVHNRGVVDAKYLENTNESLPVGSKLLISPHDVERALDVVCSTGTTLIRRVADYLS
jgi:hypothetical protein